MSTDGAEHRVDPQVQQQLLLGKHHHDILARQHAQLVGRVVALEGQVRYLSNRARIGTLVAALSLGVTVATGFLLGDHINTLNSARPN